MNEHEYHEIGTRISQTFPELTDWFRALPDEATRVTQREVRRASLIGLEASDVAEAITALSQMPVPPWMGYGLMGKGFAFIAERAREIAGKRRSREDSAGLCRQAKRRNTATKEGEPLVQASQMAKDLLDARAAGQCRTAAETRAWFAERIGESEDMRDAVRCTVCHDTGAVQCLAQVRQNRDGSWAKWYAVASCPCARGEPLRRLKEEAARVPMYDECEHVRVIPGATDEDLRAEIKRVQERRANKGRTTSFDRFNERESHAF